MADLLINKSKIEHADVELIFTTDEETGRGMDAFDISMLNSEHYTDEQKLKLNVLMLQLFVDFYGVPYHLGAARGRLVNSITMVLLSLMLFPK